jgi:hypothetical protein
MVGWEGIMAKLLKSLCDKSNTNKVVKKLIKTHSNDSEIFDCSFTIFLLIFRNNDDRPRVEFLMRCCYKHSIINKTKVLQHINYKHVHFTSKDKDYILRKTFINRKSKVWCKRLLKANKIIIIF